MDERDFIKEIYSSLLDRDWTMTQIDEMDIFHYFELIAYKSKDKEQVQTGFIDDMM